MPTVPGGSSDGSSDGSGAEAASGAANASSESADAAKATAATAAPTTTTTTTATTTTTTKTGPRRWTATEDTALYKAVMDIGECNWKAIATSVGTRNHMQCLQRWKKVLKPAIVQKEWSQEEDMRLLQLCQNTLDVDFNMIAVYFKTRVRAATHATAPNLAAPRRSIGPTPRLARPLRTHLPTARRRGTARSGGTTI